MSALLLALLLAPAEPQEDARELALGRALTQSFYQGDSERLWTAFSNDMRQALGRADDLAAFRTSVRDQFGAEAAVLDERVEHPEARPAWQTYTRRALFERATLILQWTFDAQGTVEGFFVMPADQAAPSQFLDYVTKAPLRLPFDGEWFVFWGGRTLRQNQHAVTPDQRFAYDFVMVKRGSSHPGKQGTRNEDFLCFGERVVAPADAVVVDALDGIEDNLPGVMNARQPLGNHVVLDHGSGEFSFLAHLRRGSLVFKTGDRVRAGAMLGRAGNSGRSSEPHLHYHLQTTPVFAKGDGLPAQFHSYLADGQLLTRGEPVAGQRVRNPPATPSR